MYQPLILAAPQIRRKKALYQAQMPRRLPNTHRWMSEFEPQRRHPLEHMQERVFQCVSH